MTDLCQWCVGELPLAARLYGKLTGGGRKGARQILAWPFERVIVAHNTIIERDGHAAVTEAFKVSH